MLRLRATAVTRGLDPRVHQLGMVFCAGGECAVKPAHDDQRIKRFRFTQPSLRASCDAVFSHVP